MKSQPLEKYEAFRQRINQSEQQGKLTPRRLHPEPTPDAEDSGHRSQDTKSDDDEQNDDADHGSAALSDDDEESGDGDEVEDGVDDEVSYANTIHHREQLDQQAQEAKDEAR